MLRKIVSQQRKHMLGPTWAGKHSTIRLSKKWSLPFVKVYWRPFFLGDTLQIVLFFMRLIKDRNVHFSPLQSNKSVPNDSFSQTSLVFYIIISSTSANNFMFALLAYCPSRFCMRRNS